jgi:hypothetical protein
VKVAACLLAIACALPAKAEPLRPGLPPLWLTLEGLFAQPGGDASRGPGAGVGLGYRLADQLAGTASFSTLFAPKGPVTSLAAGFEALLDTTPIAPFLELSLLRVNPVERTGFTVAVRTGFGADLQVARGLSIGAVVRYVTPLDTEIPVTASGFSGLEFGLRFVIAPAAL